MLIPITFLLLGIYLRAYQLDRALGGGDENQVLLEFAYTPINYIVTTYSHGAGGHHVFHTILLRIMILLFGEENAVAIRFPAFAAGIVCLLFIYKISREIFSSKIVARISLIVAVVCPVHIYYSQTARGYSFIMLFSVLSIYATIKLLKSDEFVRPGLLLLLSGFILVYTQPISLIFIVGLALWVLVVLAVPAFKEDFELHLKPVGKKFYQFLSIFLFMGISSVLAYWPLLPKMIKSATEDYNVSSVYSSSWDIFIHFIPNLFLKILPGPLIYFTPFFVAGIFFTQTHKRAYRLLPLVILFTTYLVSLATGLVWFPRSYLFALPLTLIFLASGFVFTGERLASLTKSAASSNWVSFSLTSVFVALSLIEIFTNQFPKTKTFNVKEYRQNINNQVQPNDLLIVPDSRHYIYARSLYKKNLLNIISDSRLAGIKLLGENDFKPEKFKLRTPSGLRSVFFNGLNKFDSTRVSEGRKINHLKKIVSNSFLPEDIEATVDWKIQSGSGEFNAIKEHKFTGEYSLHIKASPEKDLVLRGLLNQIEISQPHLLILLWSTKKFSPKDKYFIPELVLGHHYGDHQNGKEYLSRLSLGKSNEGMNILIKKKSSNEETYYWQIHSAMGMLPPGKFSLYMYLNCEAGKAIMYDSLRIFLVGRPS
jgi:hypothetical protein